MKPVSAAKRAAAVRLRVDHQLSAPAIAKRVGICNHTAYKILRPYPWTGHTPKRTDWTVAEIDTLMRLWPTASHAEIRRALPRRAFTAIGRKASSLGLLRPTEAYRRDGGKAHPVIATLEKIRRRIKLGRPAISRKSKIHVNSLCLWSLGRRMPKLDAVCRWAEAMGCELVVRKKT